MYKRILILPEGDDHLTLNAEFLGSLDLLVVGNTIHKDRYGEGGTIDPDSLGDLVAHRSDER